MTSIRRYLIIALLLVLALINTAAAFFGYQSSMVEAEKLFDDQLMSIASVLAEIPPGSYQPAVDDNSTAYQIWRRQTLVASSTNAPGEPIAPLTEGFSDVEFGGMRWRAFAGYVPDTKRWVIVTQTFDIRQVLANNIVLDSILPMFISLPLLGFMIWIIVGRGLRPVDDLANAMANKRSDDLNPVQYVETPVELAGLVNSINDLLRRLSSAFERERQFAGDAAHELRTPISVLKVQLHNLLQETGRDDPKLRALEEAVERMNRSVEQVLMLHRMSPEQVMNKFVAVDLTALAREVIAEIYPQLEALEQKVELVGDISLVTGDAGALKALLLNLVENGSRYGGEGGFIRVTIAGQSDGTDLIVEDNGPGIPLEHRERVFERFYRGERDSGPPGTGIGLAIVKNIADIHGAEISLGESTFDSGLSVRVRFRGAGPRRL
jgi:two-component system sensor histidine kinase QseC